MEKKKKSFFVLFTVLSHFVRSFGGGRKKTWRKFGKQAQLCYMYTNCDAAAVLCSSILVTFMFRKLYVLDFEKKKKMVIDR